MQMSMYNRKHWHALSHSLHIVRHEGRLATNGRTRLTRSMEANEPGFFIYPPTCAFDVGGTKAYTPVIEVLCFSYFSHLVWSVFVS